MILLIQKCLSPCQVHRILSRLLSTRVVVGSSLCLLSGSVGWAWFRSSRTPATDHKPVPCTSYKGFKLPDDVSRNMAAIEAFPLRDGDVIVASFPKSGTTWLQEIVYFLMTGVPEATASRRNNLEWRFPYLEYLWPGLEEIEMRPSPRMIKTHLPYHMLPRSLHKNRVKVLYIERDVRDVLISYYFFARMLSLASFKGSLDEFFEAFLRDDLPYCPYTEHLRGFHEASAQNSDQVHILRYEDLHRKPLETVREIARFLGLLQKGERTMSDAYLSEIISRCEFQQMKKNPSSNYSWWDELGLRRKGESDFLRKGEIGDHKNHLTPKQIERLDVLIAKQNYAHDVIKADT